MARVSLWAGVFAVLRERIDVEPVSEQGVVPVAALGVWLRAVLFFELALALVS